MPPLTIRAAQADDVGAIFGMIKELAEFENLQHLVVATEASLHDAMFGARPSCESLVGTRNGETVAFALFFHNFSTFLGRKGLYLEDLYVKREHRRQGYGRLMLAALAALALERGCGRFEWSVLDWNANAIAFYQELGAVMLPDWRICRVAGEALTQLSAIGTKSPR
jgi:GNAT superfamily N-acetyltransferase